MLTTTTTKSWRSDTLIILPGWECHTGGSRSKPTVHRCSQSGRRLWVARQVHNHEPNGSAAVRQSQHVWEMRSRTTRSRLPQTFAVPFTLFLLTCFTCLPFQKNFLPFNLFLLSFPSLPFYLCTFFDLCTFFSLVFPFFLCL